MNPQDKINSILEQAAKAQQGVDKLRAQEKAGTNVPPPVPANDTLISTLSEYLTKQGQGISTSGSSNITNAISEAIAGTQTAGALSSAALESQRQRELGFAQDRASATFTGAMEGRTGYATQVVALRELTETTQKSVRDLDMRYQEAIMSNDAATAQRVADLQMQKLQFLQEQEQNFFSNVLQMANLQETAASRQQQESQFQRGLTADQSRLEQQLGADITMFEKQTAKEERNMLLGLAAEYGVAVGPNDTIDTMIAKVSPFVGENRALELQAIRSDIAASNASAARSLQGLNGSDLSATDIEALALAYSRGNSDVVGFIEDGATMSKILDRASNIEQERKTGLNELANSVSSKEEFQKMVATGEIDASQAEIDSLSLIYEPTWAENRKKNKPASQVPSGRIYNPVSPGKLSEKYLVKPVVNVAAGASELMWNTDIPGYGFKN